MTGKRCFKTLQQGMTLLELSVVLLMLTALAGLAAPHVSGIGSTAMCQTTDATMQAVKQAIMGGGASVGFYGDTLGYYPKTTKSTTADYNLTYLFSAPTDSSWGSMVSYHAKTAVGWRGPYLQSGATHSFPVDGRSGDDGSNGTDGADDATDLTNELHTSFDDTAKVHGAVAVNDQVILDGWGRPIILQVPATCSYSNKPGGCARLVSAGPIPGRDIQSNGIDATISNVAADNRGDDRVLFLQIPDPKPAGNIPCDDN